MADFYTRHIDYITLPFKESLFIPPFFSIPFFFLSFFIFFYIKVMPPTISDEIGDQYSDHVHPWEEILHYVGKIRLLIVKIVYK
jgi:hypothetical protein